ncbi:hypothetical protein Ancab_035304 [Ancistrocladus abbreviatus]
MGEELLKRNTDCVYFLASPFTCKKGVECEYRHNEMARLNPRDLLVLDKGWLSKSNLRLPPSCLISADHPFKDDYNDLEISEFMPKRMSRD